MPNLALQPADLIYGRGIIAGETIAQEMREKLAKELANKRKHYTFPALLALARAIISEFEPLVAENLLNTDLAAWLAGFDRVAGKLPTHSLEAFARDFGGGGGRPPHLPFPLSFDDDSDPTVRFPMIEKAAERLARKNVIKREQFDQLAAWERRNAFTIAGDITRDAMETVRNILSENVAAGTSLRVFREQVENELGKSLLGPRHLETIYRTNVQAAFHDGHDSLADNPIVRDVFPYQAYFAIHDGRVRDEHLDLETMGLDGTNIYRRDDPFWDLFTPPWGYNCRCGINLLTISAAARKGVREAQEWLRTGRAPLYPEHRLQSIPFRPRNGFGGRRRAASA